MPEPNALTMPSAKSATNRREIIQKEHLKSEKHRVSDASVKELASDLERGFPSD
ncbi:MAG: hypothetical protein KDA65_06245 [Planctomycetaceae bacterium]|nr:hypothetical protein [Planctomycetaceae bacterium]